MSEITKIRLPRFFSYQFFNLKNANIGVKLNTAASIQPNPFWFWEKFKYIDMYSNKCMCSRLKWIESSFRDKLVIINSYLYISCRGFSHTTLFITSRTVVHWLQESPLSHVQCSLTHISIRVQLPATLLTQFQTAFC